MVSLEIDADVKCAVPRAHPFGASLGVLICTLRAGEPQSSSRARSRGAGGRCADSCAAQPLSLCEQSPPSAAGSLRGHAEHRE